MKRSMMQVYVKGSGELEKLYLNISNKLVLECGANAKT